MTSKSPAANGSYLQGDDADNDGVPDPSTLAATHHAVNSTNEIVSVSSSGSATAFVHDPAGNLVFDGQKVYQYDAWNRLIEVNEAGDLTYTGTDPNNDDFDAVTGKIYAHPAGDTIGPLLYRFTYDGLGRLIVTERPLPQADDPPDPACQAEHYYYDGVRRLQEVIEQPRVPAVGEPVLVEAAAWTEREYVYGPDYVDEFVAQIDDPGAASPQLMFTLQDANYNLVALVGKPASGLPEQLLVQYTYEPYGTRAAMDVATFGDPPAPAMTAANENLIGHQGLFFYRLSPGTGLSLDPATAGIYYNRGRMLEPQLGRFLQKDPNETGQLVIAAIASNGKAAAIFLNAFNPSGHFGDGMNLHAYQGLNPVGNIDPLGLDMLDEVDAWIDDRIGNAVYTLGTLNEKATLGLKTGLEIASTLLGVDVFQSVYLLASGQGGFWAAMDIVTSLNPFGRAAKLIRKGYSWVRKATRAGKLVGRFADWLHDGARNVSVYIGYRNGSAVYVGISDDVARRAGEHGKRFDHLDPIGGGLTRNEARSVEQVVIGQNPHFENKINSIAEDNEFFNDAVGWGEEWLSGHRLSGYYP